MKTTANAVCQRPKAKVIWCNRARGNMMAMSAALRGWAAYRLPSLPSSRARWMVLQLVDAGADL
jgi:hypothetical protein